MSSKSDKEGKLSKSESSVANSLRVRWASTILGSGHGTNKHNNDDNSNKINYENKI